jgi:hypothetical protein
MSCVDSIESACDVQANSSAAHTLQYAKYYIHVQDRDSAAAEAALWSVLRLPLTPFLTALQAVKVLDEESAKVDIDPVPFYKHLVGKYPK